MNSIDERCQICELRPVDTFMTKICDECSNYMVLIPMKLEKALTLLPALRDKIKQQVKKNPEGVEIIGVHQQKEITKELKSLNELTSQMRKKYPFND